MHVSIIDDKNFQLNNLNLETAVDLFPWEAALGKEIPVNAIDGKILVKIPPGIQTDSKIKVSGRGYKNTKGKRGDFFLKIRIVNPKTISKELKEEYKKINDLMS